MSDPYRKHLGDDPYREVRLPQVQQKEMSVCAWCKYGLPRDFSEGQGWVKVWICTYDTTIPLRTDPVTGKVFGKEASCEERNKDGDCYKYTPTLYTRLFRKKAYRTEETE